MEIHQSTLFLFPALVMDAAFPSWTYFVFALLILGVFLLRRMREKERSSELANIAVELGLRMESAMLPRTEEGLKALPLFSTRRRKFSNVMLGYAAGGEVLLFDFASPSGDTVAKQTVAAFYWRGASLPSFQLRPENALHRIIQKLGYQDINFENYPEFSRRYLLRGQDEGMVRDFFTANKVALMERRPPNEGLSIEAAGQWLAVFSPGVTVPTDGLHGFFDEATAIAMAFSETATKGAVSKGAS